MDLLDYNEWNKINEQASKYKVIGTFFEMFGSYRVDLRVSDNTGKVIIASGGEGTSKEQAYNIARKDFDLKAKKIGVAAPSIDKLSATTE